MFLMHTVWTEVVHWLILTKKYVIAFPCTCIWPFRGGGEEGGDQLKGIRIYSVLMQHLKVMLQN